jgi:hypothetical protein
MGGCLEISTLEVDILAQWSMVLDLWLEVNGFNDLATQAPLKINE